MSAERRTPAGLAGESAVHVCAAPEGEELSRRFGVTVAGKECPVYVAKVAPREPARRFRGMDDRERSGEYCETAAFATFDMAGPVEVAVTHTEEIRSVRVLPGAPSIIPAVRGASMALTLARPGHLTVEVNGDWCQSIHLFANPPELAIPDPQDPNVLLTFGIFARRVDSGASRRRRRPGAAGGEEGRPLERPMRGGSASPRKADGAGTPVTGWFAGVPAL